MTNILGTCRGGAKRWLKLGPMMLQTSEIMKVVIILTLAKILTSQQKTGTIFDLCIPYGVTFLAMVFILIQPDLGTSLVFIPIATIMIFSSGTPVRHFVLLILIALPLVTGFAIWGLKEYQRNRVMMFVKQDSMSEGPKTRNGISPCTIKNCTLVTEV